MDIRNQMQEAELLNEEIRKRRATVDAMDRWIRSREIEIEQMLAAVPSASDPAQTQ
eukprot:jgi/Hompol1/2224/HPOL_005894-RA